MAERAGMGAHAASGPLDGGKYPDGGSGRHRAVQGGRHRAPDTEQLPVVPVSDPANLGPVVRSTGRARAAARIAVAGAAVLAMGGAAQAASTLQVSRQALEPQPVTQERPIVAPTAVVKQPKPKVKTESKPKTAKKPQKSALPAPKPPVLVEKPPVLAPVPAPPEAVQKPVPPRVFVAPPPPPPAPPVIQPPVQKPAPPVVRPVPKPVPPPVVAKPVPNPGMPGVKGRAIAAAALAQVGRTQDCTMLVTNSLAAVNIHHHGWPISYFSLGTQVSTPAIGDLIYYKNGGAGLAHIAVYIGNGQAVHGGWTDAGTFIGNQTVIFSAQVGSGPVYIRVR